MKTFMRVAIIFIVTLLVLNYKKIIYTDYQQDFIYLYDKIIDTYPFVTPQDEQRFRENKNKYLEKIKNCKNEEEFLKETNVILNSLNSPHTMLNNKIDSYALYKAYKYMFNETPEYKNRFRYIIDEFEKQEVISKYTEINEVNSLYSFKASDINFIYFPIIKDEVGYISIENLFHPNIDMDREKVKKCLNTFKNYKTLIIDLRNNIGGDSTYFTDMFLPMIVKENLQMKYYSLIRDNTPAKANIKGIEKISENKEIKKLIKTRFGNYSDYIMDKYKYYYDSDTEVIKNKDSIEYEGKIYFLINENTGSSAGYFSAFVKDRKIGTVVGSTTSPECIGTDPAMYILPKSKLMLRLYDALIISDNLDFKKEGIISNGSISPDIVMYSNVKERLNENNAKYDYCIKSILELEN
ncbi:MAG: S41 family peptidase [Filifactoraceae bacterium]